jgi:O-antigen/teichoic acid export membrane protein
MRTGSIRLDVATAYVVTAARVGAWAVISALVYRRLGQTAFAVLALIRATAGLLTYTSLGLAPAMVRSLAEADRPQPVTPLPTDEPAGEKSGAGREPAAAVLHYALPSTGKEPTTPVRISSAQRVYASGLLLAIVLALVGVLAATAYSRYLGVLHPDLPPYFLYDAGVLALTFGAGIILRMLSEVPAGLLQVRGRISIDNMMQAGAEAAWLTFSMLMFLDPDGPRLAMVGIASAMANGLLVVARYAAVRLERVAQGVVFIWRGADWATMRRLLAFGLAVTLAQAADFLYAPMDFLLIDWLIGTRTVGVYAPAIQIDAGLAVLGSGLATVLLPRAAVAHAAGDVARLRRYYVRGTLATVGLVAPFAAVVWLASPWIFRLWLGDEMRATQAILPLVLLHNLVGNSGFVGRSVLLAMGRTRAFAASVLAAALLNVAASYTFVMLGMGLRGIVLGTIVAVCARCLLWMPWYVLRTLSRLAAERAPEPAVAIPADAVPGLPPGGPP